MITTFNLIYIFTKSVALHLSAFITLGKLHNYLDQNSTERLIHAFVTSHIEYCNSLLFGLPTSQTVPIQRIQNSAARLVCRVKRWEHVTPLFRSLHWLPVTQHIKYKILLLTYLTVNGHAPTYLQMFHRIPSIYDRHTIHNFNLQNGPRTYTHYGQRAFAVAAPSLWNNLPLHIRQAIPLHSNLS